MYSNVFIILINSSIIIVVVVINVINQSGQDLYSFCFSIYTTIYLESFCAIILFLCFSFLLSFKDTFPPDFPFTAPCLTQRLGVEELIAVPGEGKQCGMISLYNR